MMSDLSDDLEPAPLRVVPAADAPFTDVEAVFGTKGDPVVDATATEPLIVASEEIPANQEIPANLETTQSPIDDQLDSVRSAAAMITARATARSSSPTGRQDKPTVPPELMDNPNENFEQIRDRILARARAKKETTRPQSVAAATSGRLKIATLNFRRLISSG